MPTEAARAALPDAVPIADASANIAAASQLVLGIERSDLDLIGRGLADRLHQPHRAGALPAVDGGRRGGAVAGRARRLDLGRRPLGPRLVLLADDRRRRRKLEERFGEWAKIRRVPFTPLGADVPEL